MKIKFVPMDTATAEHLRSGAPDANGNPPEHKISNGIGVPCRCCMKLVGKGEPYLVAAWRPFTKTHAYAETGPVFLHAEPCSADPVAQGKLPAFLQSPDYILRGYDADERIVYGTGGVIGLGAMLKRALRNCSRSHRSRPFTSVHLATIAITAVPSLLIDA